MNAIKVCIIILLVEFSLLVTSNDYCHRLNFDSFADTFINKDMDMCTMFIQSYTGSIDLNRTVKDYLLRSLPYQYLYDGHLHTFTQYQNDYTFILASTIDKIEKQNEDHEKSKYKQNVNEELKNENSDEKFGELNYEFIDWNRSPTEIYDDILKNFHVDKYCDSILTFYLTFPSYPESNTLIEFIQNFQKHSNNPHSSSISGNQNLQYRQNINPSFLSIVDQLPLAIFQLLLAKQRNIRLVFCGHALGGTIAQLSTLHLLSKGIKSHPIQLRSISIGSLFFSKELTIQYVKNHHFEKYFINIYHEIDPIPVLFNSAEFLTYLISTGEQNSNFFSTIKSYFWQSENLIKKHQSYLTNILAWLCSSIANRYSKMSPELCNPKAVDATLTTIQKAIVHI